MNRKTTEEMQCQMRAMFSVYHQIRLAGVETADSKEAPRPASAKPAVASLLPLAALLQFAANVEVPRAGRAMVGRLVLRLAVVRVSKCR